MTTFKTIPDDYELVSFVMLNIKERVLATYLQTVPLRLRYVDDTFITKKKTNLTLFTNTWTKKRWQTDENVKVPLLDNRKLRTTLYRKRHESSHNLLTHDYPDFDKTSTTDFDTPDILSDEYRYLERIFSKEHATTTPTLLDETLAKPLNLPKQTTMRHLLLKTPSTDNHIIVWDCAQSITHDTNKFRRLTLENRCITLRTNTSHWPIPVTTCTRYKRIQFTTSTKGTKELRHNRHKFDLTNRLPSPVDGGWEGGFFFRFLDDIFATLKIILYFPHSSSFYGNQVWLP